MSQRAALSNIFTYVGFWGMLCEQIMIINLKYVLLNAFLILLNAFFPLSFNSDQNV